MTNTSDFVFLISENDFITFFLVSKNINYFKNVLDSIYKSLVPANISTKIEMNILVRFEVIQISSFSESQLISRKFTAEVDKASAVSHESLPMCPEFILQQTFLFLNMPCFCSLTIDNCLLVSNWTTVGSATFYTLSKSREVKHIRQFVLLFIRFYLSFNALLIECHKHFHLAWEYNRAVSAKERSPCKDVYRVHDNSKVWPLLNFHAN